ncbi:glycosyltransferase family 34 protein [[Candida] arabinofermentans NRRL YB-2248]|uniref:Glycosyltransferase family 34 protein n=1 Tax=[Candida] arabinofermentans NRRL YB-2248 TaxID=983967 RepID=A0A1E4T585_9ASCO|nr:glycosyltransferase family 34 protein [[Candida] arabinofermentans NRRL YB-2248]
MRHGSDSYSTNKKIKKSRSYFASTDHHDYLNTKIAAKHENLGFGRSDHKMKHKPGFPPSPSNPGIFVIDDSDEESIQAQSSNFKVLSKPSSTSSIFNIFTKPKRKIYMILGRSPEVGIKHQKSKEYWFMEKMSLINKKHYSEKHGYELIVVNSLNDKIGLQQKRYQHEFREGWEKFDSLRKLMKQTSFQSKLNKDNDDVEEWFWYVDIHTLIMEPDLSLDEVVFKNFDYMYRDLKYFNPNNLIIDEELNQYRLGSSLKETNDLNAVDLIVSQDCNGINLNSFLIKKSDWSDLLLDLIWDPVIYKQMHVKWVKSGNEQKYGFRLSSDEYDSNSYNNDIEEKNCLEYLFNTQSWIRSKIGFMPIRAFNSLSKDFCTSNDDLLDVDDLASDAEISKKKKKSGRSYKLTKDYLSNEQNFHYQEEDRDFLINYMNCEKYHNCWDRFQEFTGIYEDLHKSWFKKIFFFL